MREAQAIYGKCRVCFSTEMTGRGRSLYRIRSGKQRWLRCCNWAASAESIECGQSSGACLLLYAHRWSHCRGFQVSHPFHHQDYNLTPWRVFFTSLHTNCRRCLLLIQFRGFPKRCWNHTSVKFFKSEFQEILLQMYLLRDSIMIPMTTAICMKSATG